MAPNQDLNPDCCICHLRLRGADKSVLGVFLGPPVIRLKYTMAVWPQHLPRARGWVLNLHKRYSIHVHCPCYVSVYQALCPQSHPRASRRLCKGIILPDAGLELTEKCLQCICDSWKTAKLCEPLSYVFHDTVSSTLYHSPLPESKAREVCHPGWTWMRFIQPRISIYLPWLVRNSELNTAHFWKSLL